jgi:hypothetical protein
VKSAGELRENDLPTSAAELKWILKNNHIDSGSLLEKGEMVEAILRLNKNETIKLKGKGPGSPSPASSSASFSSSASPPSSHSQKGGQPSSSSSSASPSASLAQLSSEQLSKMSVSELKRLIRENHVQLPAGELEKGDLVCALLTGR